MTGSSRRRQRVTVCWMPGRDNGDRHKLQKKGFGALCVCACFESLLPQALGLKPSPIQPIGSAELHRRTDCSFSSSLMISSKVLHSAAT